MPKRFLVKHVGNMGDLVFLIPPVLATLKKRYPDCHITLVTAWGFKDRQGRWGKRNQSGFCIALMMADPHVDQLVHWHDTKLSLVGDICCEEGRCFPTWNSAYFEQMKRSGAYDAVYELDFGLTVDDNPIQRMYEALDLPDETFSQYQLFFTDQDHATAEAVMQAYPRPRIVLLEALEGETTRGWDPDKIPALEAAITQRYGVAPLWFGSRHIPYWQGRPLTLRENIAWLTHCDAGIGVLSAPLHFAVAVGLPTLTLWGDQPLHRGAPAVFLNQYITQAKRKHRTLLGPSGPVFHMLKKETVSEILTPAEQARQHYRTWTQPGRQATKAVLAPLTVDEVMTVLHDMLYE
jgi:ADP-heptose:LPS heptosyltransferase